MDVSNHQEPEIVTGDDDDCVLPSITSTGRPAFDHIMIKEEPRDDDNTCTIAQSRTWTPTQVASGEADAANTTERAEPAVKQEPGGESVLGGNLPLLSLIGGELHGNTFDLTSEDKDVTTNEEEAPKDASEDTQICLEPTMIQHDADKRTNTGSETTGPEKGVGDPMDIDGEPLRIQADQHNDTEMSPELNSSSSNQPTGSQSGTYQRTIDPAAVSALIASQRKKMLENKRIESLSNGAQDDGAKDQDVMIADDNDSDPEESEGFLEAEREYYAKREAGTATREDDIDYQRAKKMHDRRMQRKLDQDHPATDDQHDLFLPTQLSSYNKRRAVDDYHEIPTKRRDTGSYLSQADAHVAKQAGLEQIYRMTDKEAEPSGQGSSTHSSKAKKSRGRPKGSATKKPTKAQMKQQRAARNITNLSGFEGDVFRDVETNTARAEQPTFTSRRKDKALGELIASIPQEIRDEARLDIKQIEKASRSFTGRGSCYSDTKGGWIIKGMKESANNYQMLGIARMREIEDAADTDTVDSPCGKGGLLADWMGLGKTFEMLCNIVNGLSKIKYGEPRTTLIVSSPSIIIQWLSEIEKFVLAKTLHGEPIRYNGKRKLSCKNPINDLYNHDIVLTTYNEVQRSYPKCDPPISAVTAQEKQDWWDAHYDENRGDLHKMEFHRVVLDEAQAIKNYNSQTSVACRALTAKYYWAMSGTPIQNHLGELYPYFKFLRIPNTGTYKIFQHNYCREGDEDCTARLHAMLSKFMIRRTHNDELLGSKLLVLPKTKKETMVLHFSDLEHEVYQIVKKRFASKINGMVRDDTNLSRKQYSHILTLILRLRQLTGHILLIHDTIVDLLEPEDHEKLREVINRAVPQHRTEQATIKHLRAMLANPESLNTLEPTSEASSDSGSNATVDQPVGRAFGLKNSFGEYLDSVRGEQAEEIAARPQLLCVICKEVAKNPHMTSCNHLYCNDCLTMMTYQSLNQGIPSTRIACYECGEVFKGCEPYNAQQKEINRKEKRKLQQTDAHQPLGSEPEPVTDNPMAELEAKKKRAGNTTNKTINTWIDGRGHMIPSAKTLAVKAQILQWLKEDSSCKIIVYSQFITMIKIFAKMAEIEKFGHCVFCGTQSAERRAKVIDEFKENPKKQVMFASLKSGCNGLNLTMASRVITVDLWWNSLTEQQAFCRSYRRGQDKETALMRFVVQGSIDDHLRQMQERKDKNIDSVLAPSSNPKERMSTRELMSLFGRVEDDAEGEPFILVEDPPERTVTTKTGSKVVVGPRVVAADEDDDPAMAQEM